MNLSSSMTRNTILIDGHYVSLGCRCLCCLVVVVVFVVVVVVVVDEVVVVVVVVYTRFKMG